MADNQSATSRKRERRQQISSLQIVFVSILAIGLLLAINFSARIRRGQQIEDIRAQIQATIDVEEEINTALRRQRDYVASDQSVEEWAHEDGKMVRPGEKLVIPVPGAITPTPVPIQPETDLVEEPASTEPDITWELWWQLFFDDDPPNF